MLDSLLRGGEVVAAALVAAFVSLRCMELIDVYCQSRLHLVLHGALALLAARWPGMSRVTLLSVLYGVMRHRLDVQVYAAPASTSLAGAIVVIAGGSSGIGLALAHELAALDATTVVLGCRNLSKCELVRPVAARCAQLDLADLRSVVQFASDVRSSVPRVDYLVHNAGFLADGLSRPGRTAQGFEPSFGVMHLAHHLLTRELWELLQRPSPSGLPTQARVISHASAAFMTGDLSSILAGDGEGDLRGEDMEGCLGGSGMGKALPSAAPQLTPCASSGRAWRLWAARHSQSEARPLGARPPPLRGQSDPPPKSPLSLRLTI